MTQCPLLHPGPGCDWCGSDLPGRRRRWCSDECSRANWEHHDWNAARFARLRADNWTCVRCGFIGWNDQKIIRLQTTDHELDPYPPMREDWAVALGLLDPADANATIFNSHADRRRRAAIDKLPPAALEIIKAERHIRQIGRALIRHRSGAHQLEVNHKTPRQGKGYGPGCHHHPDELETLCRPCHVDETTRQRRNLPSWRDDPRPIEIIEGRGLQKSLI